MKVTDRSRRVALAGGLFVALLGLGSWSTGLLDPLLTRDPADHALVGDLTTQWAQLWPQLPGPPQDYRRQADTALASGDLRGASEWTRKALTLEPNHAGDLMRLVSLAGLGERSLTAEQAQGLVTVLAATDTEPALLEVAQAWGGILTGNPTAGVALESSLLEGRLSHLAAVQLDHGDPLQAALDVLELAPGQPAACAPAARSHVLSRQPAEALLIIADCESAGVRAGMDRLAADALDDLGRFSEAAARYDAAGATTHAAIIRIQEGLSGEIALEHGPPDAELHRLWWGLLTNDEARIRAGQAGMAQSGISGPEFEMALAVSALWDGLAAAAAVRVEELTSTESRAILARARFFQDDPVALSLLDEAVENQPNNLRLRLAHAKVSGEGLEAVLSVHPVQAALYADSRRRDVPWPAILPTTWLVDGMTQREAALTRMVLGEGTPEGHTDPLIDRWVASPDPLWSWSGDLPTIQPAAEVVSLQGDGLADSVSRLRALALRHPDAVGLQALLLRLQTSDVNR
ncbi:MAG: tetratricopeptide (TPR) repeat protein [Myxococcota bacterium]